MGSENGLLLGRPIKFQTDRNGNSSISSAGMNVVDPGTQVAGAITGTLAGTYIKGPDVYCADGFIIGGHPANSSYVTYGNSGTLGMAVDVGGMLPVPVDNLNQLFLSVAVSGDKITWSML